MDRLNSEAKLTLKNIGDMGAVGSDDLSFTGRVYLYVEQEFTLQQAAELDKYYKDKGMSLTIRDLTYASARWLQDSESPPPPPVTPRDAVWNALGSAIEARVAGLTPEAKSWLYKLLHGEPPNNVPDDVWNALAHEHLVIGPDRAGASKIYRRFIEAWFVKNDYKPAQR
jgi:hypothetical protein